MPSAKLPVGSPGAAVAEPDPDTQRSEALEHWERAAVWWEKRAWEIREHGMPVSMWMIRQLGLQPGQRLLELAAGPGDTGLLAAELIKPAGTLISSDASEAMLEVARKRAAEMGISNVEFVRLELEWIDLPTAEVDAVLCRWGLMLVLDPEAAAREIRRVLRPGGHLAVAVWDQSDANPWATVPHQVMVKLGLVSSPPPGSPGMFALAAPGQLGELLETAGFVDPLVEAVEIERSYPDVEAFVEETLDLSQSFRAPFAALDDVAQREVVSGIAAGAAPFTAADGSITLPGRSLVASASA